MKFLAALLISMTLFAPARGAAAAESAEPTTTVELRLQGVEAILALPEDERGRLVLERVDQAEQPSVVLPLRPTQTVTLPISSRWVTRFEVRDLWGPRTLLETDPSAPRIWAFNLRPAGRLVGRVTSRNLPLPKRFFATSVLAGLGKAESACSIGEKGDIECVVPAGSQEVVLAVGTFAPVRFRDQKVEAGKSLTLPTTELLPGASLRGEVAMPRDGATAEKPADRPQVRVFRFLAGAKPSLEPPQPMAATVTAVDGTFSFVGLEPGPVILEVTWAGYSPFRLFPLELAAGTEVSVPEPIELTRPFEVVVEVTPATDTYGLPWTVALERGVDDPAAPGGFHTLEGRTDPEGRFRAPDQTTGRRRLEIRDSAGNKFHRDSDVWIAPGGEAFITVELPLVSVTGRVTLDGKPEVATLHFGGRRGRRHVEIQTDDEGRFEGTLPKSGPWSIDVETAEFSTFTKVDVTPGLDEHRAEVDIELPDTHLFGRVVDEQGNPVAGAVVEVSVREGFRDETTANDGTFEARAIPPGLVTVAADLRKSGQEPLTSEPQLLELREEQPLGPLELRLRSLERREVRVFRGSHPVPGAVVGLAARDGSRFADRAITDLAGSARLRVDPKAREWDVILSAPGAMLSAFRRSNAGTPLEFQLEEQGGELTVELPRPLEQLVTQGLQVVVLREGVAIGLAWLAEWRRGLGLPAGLESTATRLGFPRLAAGSYTVCLDRFEEARRALTAESEENVACRQGHLPAGGELSLELAAPRD